MLLKQLEIISDFCFDMVVLSDKWIQPLSLEWLLKMPFEWFDDKGQGKMSHSLCD